MRLAVVKYRAIAGLSAASLAFCKTTYLLDLGFMLTTLTTLSGAPAVNAMQPLPVERTDPYRSNGRARSASGRGPGARSSRASFPTPLVTYAQTRQLELTNAKADMPKFHCAAPNSADLGANACGGLPSKVWR